MSCTIIFKQSFKARASPGAAGLNVRHLNYIATRPGAVYNPGCGFGLWGQLPGDGGIRIQSDLEKAKQDIRRASEKHTLYRAIISVGKQDAQEHGLYDRNRWEQIVNDRIGAIAKEMDIKQEDFCWCASFHYSKDHPHVHIIYWDNGDQPRNEVIPKAQFEEKAEHIRSEFAREIHREEILEVQKEQRQQLKSLRAMVQAMCVEANPEKALNLPRLYNGAALEALSKQLYALIRDLPGKGSLRYAYLPAGYKEQVNALIRSCLQVPELARELERYDGYTRQISELYANGAAGTGKALEAARSKLYKELGNEVMGAIREIRSEIQANHPSDLTEAQRFVREIVRDLVPPLDSYQTLLTMLPVERIPASCMAHQIPGYREQMNQVIKDVMLDARVRLRLQSYALAMAGIDIDAKPNAKPKQPPSSEGITQNEAQPNRHTVYGKALSEDEWNSYLNVYQEAKRDLREVITAQARQDAGWTDEALRTGTAMMLCSMMRLLSQTAHQRGASAAQAKLVTKARSKDKSREAKKDYRATQAHAGEWSDGYD